MGEFDPTKIKTPERFECRKPDVLEIVLKSPEEVARYLKIGGDGLIHLQGGLDNDLKHNSVLSITLEGANIFPVDSKIFSPIAGKAMYWHRDDGYPILGLYKPLGHTRVDATEFTISTCSQTINKDLLVNNEVVFRNEYTNPNVSKITFFVNVILNKRGEFLFHKNEAKTNDPKDSIIFSAQHINYPMWAGYQSHGKFID